METNRVAFETARLRLARYRMEGEQSRSRAVAHATQVSAEALDVQRVGLWLFRNRDQRLVCVCRLAQLTRTPEPPSVRLGTEVGPQLEAAILSCLAKRAEARPAQPSPEFTRIQPQAF